MIILFQGVRISKREANKVGVGITFGIIGVVVSQLFVGRKIKYWAS